MLILISGWFETKQYFYLQNYEKLFLKDSALCKVS